MMHILDVREVTSHYVNPHLCISMDAVFGATVSHQ